jgi:hypothetical protein
MPEWQVAQTGGIAPSLFQWEKASAAELEWPDRDHAAMAEAFGMAICSGAKGPLSGRIKGGASPDAGASLAEESDEAGPVDWARPAVIAHPSPTKAIAEMLKTVKRRRMRIVLARFDEKQ